MIELLQLVFAIGSFEVDDLINNSLGAFLGYALSIKVISSHSELNVKKSIGNVCLSALITNSYFLLSTVIRLFSAAGNDQILCHER